LDDLEKRNETESPSLQADKVDYKGIRNGEKAVLNFEVQQGTPPAAACGVASARTIHQSKIEGLVPKMRHPPDGSTRFVSHIFLFFSLRRRRCMCTLLLSPGLRP
jgi:hypothetical protein